MLSRAKKSLIGMFVTGAIVLLLGALFILSPSLFSDNKFLFVCYFSDSLKGLSAGSPVYLLGVPVGRVESVHIGDPFNIESYVAPVVISLDKAGIFNEYDKAFFDQDDADVIIESYISKGLVAQIESQSLLTGQLAIELSFSQARLDAIPEFYDDMLQIPTMQERLSQVWEKVSEIPFVEIGSDVESLLANVNALVSSLEEVVTKSNIPQLSQEISNLVASLAVTSKNLNTMIESNEKNVDGLLKSFNTLSRNSNKLVQDLSQTTSSESALMIQFSETLKALEAASKAITEIAIILEIKPDALIFGK